MSSNKDRHFLGLSMALAYNINLFHNKSSGMLYLEGRHLVLTIPKPKKVKIGKKNEKSVKGLLK